MQHFYFSCFLSSLHYSFLVLLPLPPSAPPPEWPTAVCPHWKSCQTLNTNDMSAYNRINCIVFKRTSSRIGLSSLYRDSARSKPSLRNSYNDKRTMLELTHRYISYIHSQNIFWKKYHRYIYKQKHELSGKSVSSIFSRPANIKLPFHSISPSHV